MPFMPKIPTGEACHWAFGVPGYQCPGDAIHVVGLTGDGGEFRGQIYLCHDHYLIAAGEGLIAEPFVGREEFVRRGGDPV